MTKKAKQYSSEEKAKVAIEAIKAELTIAQISSKYGVHATQINKWKQEALQSMILPTSAVFVKLKPSKLVFTRDVDF